MADGKRNDPSFKGKPIPSKGLTDYSSKSVSSTDSPSVVRLGAAPSGTGIGGTGTGRGVHGVQNLPRRFYKRVK
jgi:hypothetical protein